MATGRSASMAAGTRRVYNAVDAAALDLRGQTGVYCGATRLAGELIEKGVIA